MATIHICGSHSQNYYYLLSLKILIITIVDSVKTKDFNGRNLIYLSCYSNGYGAHKNGICIDEVKRLTDPDTTKEKYDTMEDGDIEITKNFQEDDEEPLVTSFLKTSRFKRGITKFDKYTLWLFSYSKNSKLAILTALV